MDPMLEILFLLWFIVFPILGILTPIISLIFWFLIVPKIARKLTWKRFSKCSFHMIADDSGFTSLISTKEELPEGIVNTKEAGFRFLPRPRWLRGNPDPTDSEIKAIRNLSLRKFIWKDMGKPFWLGYAGKVAAFNPTTLAILQQNKDAKIHAENYISKIREYVNRLGQPMRKDLTNMLKELNTGLDFKSLTLLDPTKVKSVLAHMYTPSQIAAVAVNREMKGMKRAGRQYTPLIIGGGIILAILAVAIIALVLLT